jgi:hypothetical protein
MTPEVSGFFRVSTVRAQGVSAVMGAAIAVALNLGGCSDPGGKGPPTGASTTSATGSANAAPSGSSSAQGAASGSAAGSASGAPAGSASADGATWKGTYKAKVGAVTPPKEAAVEVWAKDPGTAAIGDGTISLTVTQVPSGKFSRVVGEGKGALGDLVISGTLDADGLTARIDAKDPKAPTAMSGTLSGKQDGAKIEATLRVSGRDANVVREATITLTR